MLRNNEENEHQTMTLGWAHNWFYNACDDVTIDNWRADVKSDI